jgi:hypothetical protein
VACVKAQRRCPHCRKGLHVKNIHKIFLPG